MLEVDKWVEVEIHGLPVGVTARDAARTCHGRHNRSWQGQLSQPSTMATEPAAATQSEQEPLLKSSPSPPLSSPPSYHDAEIQANESLDIVEVEKKRSRWTIFWYIVGIVAAIAILAVFIKAFIDADDVEFDWKKTFMSALGGGLSGAAGSLSVSHQ